MELAFDAKEKEGARYQVGDVEASSRGLLFMTSETVSGIHLLVLAETAFSPSIMYSLVIEMRKLRGGNTFGGFSASGVTNPREPPNNINTPLHGRRALAFDMCVDGAYLSVVGG